MAIPYPPCVSDESCVSPYKSIWPELVGRDVEEAKAIITRDNPLVTVVPIDQHHKVIVDLCCNRVWLFYDNKNNLVRLVPKVG